MCFNPITKKCIVSRDVKFEEDYPYFTSRGTTTNQGEELFELFPLPQNFDHPVLEDNLVSMSLDGEEVQSNLITPSPITASERDDESHSDHSQPPTKPQVIKRNPH
ncbi:hypothetical protein ACFX1Q_014203 [Malus domestica]